MAELGASQRQALALAYYRGMVHTEIAESLGAPLGTVKAWVRRGLDKLKELPRSRRGVSRHELPAARAPGPAGARVRARHAERRRAPALRARAAPEPGGRLAVARLAGAAWPCWPAGLPPMAPRDAVWQGLEQRLFPRAPPAPRSRGLVARCCPAARSAARWPACCCAVLVLRLQPGLIGLEPQREALPASYVGLLTDAEGKPTVLASSRRHGRQLTVKLLQPLAVPAGRVAQLWALPKDGSAAVPGRRGAGAAARPRSRCRDSVGEAVLQACRAWRSAWRPTPAKPGDQPTQPFVLSGHCVKLW